MVWNVNLTANPYCAALEFLTNVSDCHAIQRTQRMLSTLCSPKPSSRQVSSQPIRDTKVEVTRFVKDLLQHLRKIVRHGKLN
ncbi:interleukin-13 [Pteropus alecto]|uniref:interleukin-13 n=1 Tax=Pteropus alecto TaxID=9402 RepID=UPI000D538128|nr:interleukin-13 [Pteropus alecto]